MDLWGDRAVLALGLGFSAVASRARSCAARPRRGLCSVSPGAGGGSVAAASGRIVLGLVRRAPARPDHGHPADLHAAGHGAGRPTLPPLASQLRCTSGVGLRRRADGHRRRPGSGLPSQPAPGRGAASAAWLRISVSRCNVVAAARRERAAVWPQFIVGAFSVVLLGDVYRWRADHGRPVHGGRAGTEVRPTVCPSPSGPSGVGSQWDAGRRPLLMRRISTARRRSVTKRRRFSPRELGA